MLVHSASTELLHSIILLVSIAAIKLQTLDPGCLPRVSAVGRGLNAGGISQGTAGISAGSRSPAEATEAPLWPDRLGGILAQKVDAESTGRPSDEADYRRLLPI